MKKHIYIYLLWDALQLLRPNSVWDSTRRQTWASNTQGPLPNAFFWLPTALSVFTCPWVSWCQFCLCRCKQSILILIMQCQFFFEKPENSHWDFVPWNRAFSFVTRTWNLTKTCTFYLLAFIAGVSNWRTQRFWSISFSKLNLHDI